MPLTDAKIADRLERACLYPYRSDREHQLHCFLCQAAARLRARETPPTCATCQSWWSKGAECWHPSKPFVALNANPETFGCTLHEPLTGQESI